MTPARDRGRQGSGRVVVTLGIACALLASLSAAAHASEMPQAQFGASDSVARVPITAGATELVVPPGGTTRGVVHEALSRPADETGRQLFAVAHLWLRIPTSGDVQASALADGQSFMELSSTNDGLGQVVDAVGLVQPLESARPAGGVVYFANYLMFDSLADGIETLEFESVGGGYSVLPTSFIELTPSDHRENSLESPTSIDCEPDKVCSFDVVARSRGNRPAGNDLSLQGLPGGGVHSVAIEQVGGPSGEDPRWKVSLRLQEDMAGAVVLRATGANNAPSAAIAVRQRSGPGAAPAALVALVLLVPPTTAALLLMRRRLLPVWRKVTNRRMPAPLVPFVPQRPARSLNEVVGK